MQENGAIRTFHQHAIKILIDFYETYAGYYGKVDK